MNISEFFAQGGYAWYIWGAFSMGGLLLGGEILQLRWQRQMLLRRLRRLQQMRQLL